MDADERREFNVGQIALLLVVLFGSAAGGSAAWVLVTWLWGGCG